MNRRKITTIIHHCQIQKELDGSNYSICIFDIDNFKKVNDTYGHDAGDFILKKITSSVRQNLDQDTEIARWGGEEFLIVFKYHDSMVTKKLEEIRKKIEAQENIWKEKNIPITLTFGVSSSKLQENPDKIIMDADDNLYWGKTHGKNQVCVSKNF